MHKFPIAKKCTRFVGQLHFEIFRRYNVPHSLSEIFDMLGMIILIRPLETIIHYWVRNTQNSLVIHLQEIHGLPHFCTISRNQYGTGILMINKSKTA